MTNLTTRWQSTWTFVLITDLENNRLLVTMALPPCLWISQNLPMNTNQNTPVQMTKSSFVQQPKTGFTCQWILALTCRTCQYKKVFWVLTLISVIEVFVLWKKKSELFFYTGYNHLLWQLLFIPHLFLISTSVLTIPFSPWSQTLPWCYWCFSSSCRWSPFAPSRLWRCRRLLKHR